MFRFRQPGCSRFDEAKVYRPGNVIRLINICIRIKIFTSVCCRLLPELYYLYNRINV